MTQNFKRKMQTPDPRVAALGLAVGKFIRDNKNLKSETVRRECHFGTSKFVQFKKESCLV